MKKLLLGLPLCLLGCGERPASWDTTFVPTSTVALESSIAVVDEGTHQLLLLEAPRDLELETSYVSIGRSVATMQASADGKQLYLLSRGEQPRREPDDEKPGFTIVEPSPGKPRVVATHELEQPLTGLVIDPSSEWAVIYDGGNEDSGLVVNPNELILVNLVDPTSEPVSKTLRSEGGRPQRLHFTSALQLPDGSSRRFLVVEREHDLALVDLVSLEHITVGSPENENQNEAMPAEVVHYPGDDENNAQFAVRYSGDPSVGVLELHEAESADELFSLSYNLVDVGGVPSAIEFVRNDAGIRLAAVVPSTSSAVLVDTVTSESIVVDLDFAFTGLELVTDDIAQRPDQSDVALLFSQQATAVGFWTLGKTSGQPYRSLETQEIGRAVSTVYDVPGDVFPHIKILKSASGGEFFVLDLNQKQSFPMQTLSSLELQVAPDGERLWAYQAGGTGFARVTFSDLHPVSLSVERPIARVFDIARGDGGRALVALHTSYGTLGATVFDALAPDTAVSRFYSGFEFGGLK